MEKVVITEEEKNALVQYISVEKNRGEKTKVPMIEYFVATKSMGTTFNGTYSLLNRFTPEQFALLLCDWYEVDQPFKVGDWVYNKLVKGYRKIVIETLTNDKEVNQEYVLKFAERYEKVIEPWKIMLLELGRDKPEFNPNDIIITGSDVYKADWLTDKDIINLYEKGVVKAFHAYENRIEVKDYDSNRE